MGIIMTTKELRPRDKNDHYPTPIELCRASLELLASRKYETILDPGCGKGPWGRAARQIWPLSLIEGVDIDPTFDRSYNRVHKEDFLGSVILSQQQYQLVMGNPPYRQAEEFIRKGMGLLAHDGTMIFLLRLNFLEGQKRGKGLWKEFPPSDVYVCSRRPSYTGDGKTDATAYMLCCWGKRRFTTDTTTHLDWLEWDYDQST